MSVQVPLRLAAGPAPVARGAALRFPALSLGGGVASDERENRVLRAIAAAATLKAPKKALALVQSAKDDPASVIVEDIDAKVVAVIDAVTNAADVAPSNVTPDATHRAVAAAVGADPILVKVASDKLADDAVDAVRCWVGSLDVTLLERGGRAAVRVKLLKLPSAPQSADTVKTEISTLKDRVLKLEAGRIKSGGGTAIP